jgi:hypothetical protein
MILNALFPVFRRALLFFAVVVWTALCAAGPPSDSADRKTLEFCSRQNADGSWGVALQGAGMASAEQPRPLKLEVWNETDSEVSTISGGYTTMARAGHGWTGAGRLTLDGGPSFDFEDHWVLHDDVLRLDRTVRVRGSAPGGFLSAATLDLTGPRRWQRVEWFAPGMIYGGFANLTDIRRTAVRLAARPIHVVDGKLDAAVRNASSDQRQDGGLGNSCQTLATLRAIC